MEQEEIKEQNVAPDKEQDPVENPQPEPADTKASTDSEADASPADEEPKRGRKKRHEQHQIEELQSKIEEQSVKIAELNGKYVRVYSEYENYRKRTSAEKADLILNGGKDVIKLMLPVIDDMERALSSLPEDDSSRQGLQLIYKNMMNALQQKGLKPMEAMGAKFDENFHEAITQIPAPAPEAKGTVVDVVKKGYFLHEEVLRYAQVVVAN